MDWPPLTESETIPSPGLLVDRSRVRQNIATMVDTVGETSVDRLRPHVKTHKMPAVMRLQLDAGITRFKAATLAEMEMAAESGARDLLLAYQPVGLNISRLSKLIARFPDTRFATVTDCREAAEMIASTLGDTANPLPLFLDVDCGMHRTGTEIGASLDALRSWVEAQPGLELAGLHAYDGHHHDPELAKRERNVTAMKATLDEYLSANPVDEVVVSGSPTFNQWATQSDWQCSPGTTLFWDTGYADAFPDMSYRIAACLLTRVISKPGGNRVCLDLGHKAVASENPLAQRVRVPALPDATFVGHSEEHLVLETSKAADLRIGDAFPAFPKHICPTVALHARATVVEDGRPTGKTWLVAARDR